MATEAPWTDPEFIGELQSKLGSNWEQRLQDSWGGDWQKSCAQALTDDLGSDWPADAGAAAERLTELVAGTTADETVGTTTEPPQPTEEQAPADPNEPLSVDLSRYQWLSTVAESDSMESWLVRVGVPGEQAAALADESGAAASGTAAGQGRAASAPVDDISKYQWLNLVAESDSLKSWLVRIGIPEQDAAGLAEAAEKE